MFDNIQQTNTNQPNNTNTDTITNANTDTDNTPKNIIKYLKLSKETKEDLVQKYSPQLIGLFGENYEKIRSELLPLIADSELQTNDTFHFQQLLQNKINILRVQEISQQISWLDKKLQAFLPILDRIEAREKSNPLLLHTLKKSSLIGIELMRFFLITPLPTKELEKSRKELIVNSILDIKTILNNKPSNQTMLFNGHIFLMIEIWLSILEFIEKQYQYKNSFEDELLYLLGKLKNWKLYWNQRQQQSQQPTQAQEDQPQQQPQQPQQPLRLPAQFEKLCYHIDIVCSFIIDILSMLFSMDTSLFNYLLSTSSLIELPSIQSMNLVNFLSKLSEFIVIFQDILSFELQSIDNRTADLLKTLPQYQLSLAIHQNIIYEICSTGNISFTGHMMINQIANLQNFIPIPVNGILVTK